MVQVSLKVHYSTIFLLSDTRLRESSPVMHVHACCLQDKRVSFLQGIQPDFYQAISGDTSGSSGYEILLNTASAVTMWANMLQRHILQFPPVRETADCVSSGRLREVKNN